MKTSQLRISQTGMIGPRALIAAIIGTAFNDLTCNEHKYQRTATNYFQGPLFRHHMELLDLDPDILPNPVRVAQGKR